ncbi:hypothetical protein [Janibacter sp. GXQ6167]|uniref:hypothetical protein n=1 Tax=Janibacter sp. GXQ6167 TaxID=3240791 RepID=UPI0035262FE0
MTRIAILGLAAAAATSVALLGCTAKAPGDAESTPSAGRELSPQEAAAALPGLADIDQRFDSETDGVPDVDADRSTYPADCLKLTFGGPTMSAFTRDHRVAFVGREYSGEGRGTLTLTVSSHDEVVPKTPFDDAGNALGKCATFSNTAHRTTSTWSTELIGTPGRGEQSFGTRMTLTKDVPPTSEGTIVDEVRVRQGHNLITVSYFVPPSSTPVPGVVDRAVEATVASLERSGD